MNLDKYLTSELYVLRFVCYTGHGNFDAHFDTKERADFQYERANKILNEWLNDNKHKEVVLVIPFSIKADDGLCWTINLINYMFMRLDNDTIIKSQVRSKNSVERAQTKYTMGGFDFPKKLN